jgi:hypothetical protein
LAKDLDAAASGRIAAEKQAYMSLPRPGVNSVDSLSDSVQVLSVSGVSCDSPCSSTSNSSTSAFAPYKKQEIFLNKAKPDAPVILRQKSAPLAKFDEDDPAAVEKMTNKFENRMSLILDSLKSEANSLSELHNAPRSKLQC